MSVYDDVINGLAAPDNATRYLENNTELTQMAKQGYGKQFVWDQVRARLGNVDVGAMIDHGLSQVLLNGMEDSGVGSKVSAGAIGQAAGAAYQAELAANQENAQAALGAQRTVLGVKQHQDNLDFQRDSLIAETRMRQKENETGWAGTLMTGLDLFNAASGAGAFKAGAGLLKKIF